MKTVKCQNGIELQYDDTLKSGDLITTYYKGYYVFVAFGDRGKNNSPLAYFRKVASVVGKPCKSNKILECDASYCSSAVDQIKETISDLQKLIQGK